MHRMWIAAVLLTALSWAGGAHAQVARVLRIDGAATVDHAGQPRRLLGMGEQLAENAVITVAKESYVMLEFRDETRVTLRPNTVFRVEAYVDQTPESVRFGLAKGGLRAISGLVGKRNPQSVQVNTTSAWVGIRGTEFDVRLCELDCDAEERSATQAGKGRAPAAARVVEMDGIAGASGSTLPSRLLAPGAMLFERDTIATAPGAYVTIAFPDGSRATLSGNSVLALEQFRFERANPRADTARLRLLDGGVRVMTGTIAQRSPQAYRIETAFAPIEARGLLFDAFCTGACAEPQPLARAEMLRMKEQAERAIALANVEAGIKGPIRTVSAAVPASVPDRGLVVHTVQGSVVVGGGAEPLQVQQGTTAIRTERDAAARLATQPLGYVVNNPAPRPDLVTVDPGFFDEQKGSRYEPGLYLWVREGAITLNRYEQPPKTASVPEPIRLAAAGGNPTDAGQGLLPNTGPLVLQAGQAAFLTPNEVVVLPHVPTFMRLDTTPPPTRANVPVNLPFFRGRDGSTVGACLSP